MTDSFFEIHETAITSAECDKEGQHSVYNIGQFSGMGGAKIGTTMQEAEWFYLLNTSAEIITPDQQNGYGSGDERKVNEVVKQHRIRACVLDRLDEKGQAAQRGNGVHKARVGT